MSRIHGARLRPALLPALILMTAPLFMAALWPGNLAAAPSDKGLDREGDNRNWNDIIGLDFGSFLSTRSAATIGVGGLAAVWTWDEFDEKFDITRKALDNSIFDGALDLGSAFGSGWVIGGSSVALLAGGQLANKPPLTAFGGDLLRSFAYSGAAVWGLKYSFNRTRPSGGPYSFPSGHTTSAFSAVPVVWYHLGWVAGTVSGAMSVLTAAGRMEESRHYLSDVIFGATLGTVCGWAVTDYRREDEFLAHLAIGPNLIAMHWEF